MSRGRKPIEITFFGWEKVFYESVGTYVQYINLNLSNKFTSEPLSKHIRIIGGYAFKSTEYKKKGIPVIRISDFSNEKIILNDVVYYEESQELQKFELKEGDIIIALTGGTIAKLGIVQKGIGKLYLNQRVGKFEVLNPDEFESEYVYWIARSVQSIIKGLAWGAAIPNVSPKQIEELEFPIPDKKTQKGIIDFLNDLRIDKIDKKVYFNKEVERHIYSLQHGQIIGNSLKTELTNQQDLLSQLRQAFLREAMQGKLVKQDPKDGHAKDLLEKIKAEKTKSGKKEKELPPIKLEEIPFEIPGNWVWCRLGDVISYADNLDIQKKLSPNTLINYVDIDSIDNKKYVISDVKQKKVSELSTRARRVLNKGYLVYSTVRPYLKNIAIVKDELPYYIGSTGFNVFRAVEADLNFIFYFLLSPNVNEKYKEMMVGFNSPSITNEQFEKTLFPLPPISEQIRIVNKLTDLMESCDEMQQSIGESREQNELLLQQVLKEALRRHDYEKEKL